MASRVSAQQPALQRSATEEFNTKMLNMVSRLEMTDIIFFYKKVTRSMATETVQGAYAYSLEFPHDFHTHHKRKFGKDATFVTPDSHQTWPIKITVHRFKESRDRVFAYGLGGWKAFVMDNHIKVGDILIFKLLKFACFEVHIDRSPAEVHSDGNKNAHQDNANQDNADQDQDNAEEDNADQAPVRGMSSDKLPLWPTFVETIRRPSEPEHPENHFYLEKDLSFVVPSRFWELHSHMLEGNELQLKGPTKTVTMVKVERTYDGGVHKVCLGHFGWKAFLHFNNLAIGDVLEFSLVANSNFNVKKVGWMKNH